MVRIGWLLRPAGVLTRGSSDGVQPNGRYSDIGVVAPAAAPEDAGATVADPGRAIDCAHASALESTNVSATAAPRRPGGIDRPTPDCRLTTPYSPLTRRSQRSASCASTSPVSCTFSITSTARSGAGSSQCSAT